MNRPLRSLAVLGVASGAVAATMVLVATANVGNPACTPSGVSVLLSDFNPRVVNNVPVTVALKDGTVVATKVVAVKGSGTFDIDVPARVGDNVPVDVTATWGPGDSGTVPATARCVTPPTAPEPPFTPGVPGDSQAPPPVTVPTVPTTPTTPTTPSTTPRPPKPVRDCTWLRSKGASRKALIARGCAWYFGPKVCTEGKKRVVTRRGGVVIVVCTVGARVTG